MNLERLVTDRLHRDAAGRAPDGLLATALARVAVTSQERAPWLPRLRVVTGSRTNRPLLLIAATLVTVGLLGALALAGGPPRPTRVPVGPLTPNRYYLDIQLQNYPLNSSATPPANGLPLDGNGGGHMGAQARVTLEVPAGWSSDGVEITKEGSGSAGGLTLRVGTIDDVYGDPCHWSSTSVRDPASIRTVSGLVGALTRSEPAATAPVAATVAGLRGLYLEVSTPTNVDTAACDYGQYALFDGPDGGRDPAIAGQLDRLWVVDVDGQTPGLLSGVVLIDARSGPGTSQRDIGELQAVVASMGIEQLPPTAMAQGGPPRPLPANGQLDPGNYFMTNPCSGECSAYTQIVFNVPGGWATGDGSVYKHLGLPTEVGFSAWTVDGVYTDPCHWRNSAKSPLVFDHSYDGSFHLTNEAALLEQLHATSATQVRLGGGDFAVRVEQTVPANLDLSTCDDGQYRTWTGQTTADGANAHHAAGQRDALLIVDLDRRPLVLDAWHMPGSPAEDVAQLDQIVDTLLIH